MQYGIKLLETRGFQYNTQSQIPWWPLTRLQVLLYIKTWNFEAKNGHISWTAIYRKENLEATLEDLSPPPTAGLHGGPPPPRAHGGAYGSLRTTRMLSQESPEAADSKVNIFL